MKRETRFIILGFLLVLTGYVIGFSRKQVSVSSPNPLNTPNSLILSFPEVLPASGSATFAKVIKVFDGDTIEIETGEKVRYIGVDAVEVYPTPQCFSEEVLSKNKELVLGKVVRLEKDISETDKYGRLLRYIYIDGTFINNELVKNGFAKVMTVPPDIKYKDQFLESEKYARNNNLGLWSSCPIFP